MKLYMTVSINQTHSKHSVKAIRCHVMNEMLELTTSADKWEISKGRWKQETRNLGLIKDNFRN